jgi:O-antigen ligase
MIYLALVTLLVLWLVFAAAGGVVPLPFHLACLGLAGIATAQAVRWLRQTRLRTQVPPLSISLPACALIGFTVLQCIPLPQSWALALWPAREVAVESLRQANLLNQAAWQTISLRPAATIDIIILVMAGLCVFLISYSLIFRSSLPLQRLLTLVAFVGIAQACFSLISAAPGSANWVATGSFVNRNHFACLMGVSLPITMALGWQAGVEALHDEFRAFRNAVISVFWLACSGLLIFALVLSQSRGGFLAALCGLMVAGALLVLRLRGPKRSYTLVGLGAVVAVFFVAMPTPELAGRFLEVKAIDGMSSQSRIEIWKASLDLFRNHWAVGVGAGAFEDAFVSHNAFAAGKRVDYAHNDYLQVLVELGVIGALPVLFLAGAIAWHLAKAVRSASGDTLLFLQASAGSLASFAVHEFVEFNLAIPVLVLLIAWIASAVCGQAVLLGRAEVPRRHSFAIDVQRPRPVPLRGAPAEV